MRCEREIIGENFEKKEKTGEKQLKKKSEKKILGKIMGENKT